MKAGTQGLLVGLTGAVCLRLAVTGEYLRYVNAWMRWPLLVTAVILLLLGVRLVWGFSHRAPERGLAAAWLLVLPLLAVFAISPPALGAYAAERSAIAVAANRNYHGLGSGEVVSMNVSEFQGRAQWDHTLRGNRVRLTGFVTLDNAGNWYVTSLAMSCCAADAVAYRVRIDSDQPEPAEGAWVRVTGTWVEPKSKKVPRLDPPAMKVNSVVPVPTPRTPYE